MSAVLAPAGWGHRPGTDLVGRHPNLPDLPLLHVLGKGSITPTLREALLTVPELIPDLTARQLMDQYRIGRSLAHDVLRSLRA